MLAKTGGHGDKILASRHDPLKGWYWLRRTPERAYFNPEFRPVRGRVTRRGHYRLKPGSLLLNPHVKAKFSADNRQWPLDRWQELADSLDCPAVQCGPAGTVFLKGVQTIVTPSFEHAVGVLAACRAMVSSEGGLMHAAGALHKPAVIIWGAWSEPEVMGYDDHIHIAEPDPEAVGWRYSHPRCRAAMERITTARVLDGIRRLDDP